MINPSQQPRVDPLPEELWSSDVAAAMEPVMQAVRSAGIRQLPGIYATFAHHERLLLAILRLGMGSAAGWLLPARIREIAILRTAINCGSGYEWSHHVRTAPDLGVTATDLTAAVAGPEGTSDQLDALVLRAADQLHSSSTVSSETWDGLMQVLTVAQALELFYLVGHYHTVAFVLNSLNVQVEAGFEVPLPTVAT